MSGALVIQSTMSPSGTHTPRQGNPTVHITQDVDWDTLASPSTKPKSHSTTVQSSRAPKPTSRSRSWDLGAHPVRKAASSSPTKRARPPRTNSLPHIDEHVDTPSKKTRNSTLATNPSARPSVEMLSLAERKEKNDRLGTLVSESVKHLSESKSWGEFVEASRGCPHLSSKVKDIKHPAATFLEDPCLNGVPVKTTDPEWTPAERLNKFHYGAHATAEMNKAFIREEMAKFMECGFWTALPYELVKDLPNLHISPLGMKEEREHKPQLVCNHSFFGVNGFTISRTPSAAMQFSGALPRIMDQIRHADPSFGPTYLSKCDIKDGFYHLFLSADDAPALAVTLPHYKGEPPLLAIPLVLTMGWTESPPTFCAMSKTIADLANASAYKCTTSPHWLETICEEQDEWVAATKPSSPISPACSKDQGLTTPPRGVPNPAQMGSMPLPESESHSDVSQRDPSPKSRDPSPPVRDSPVPAKGPQASTPASELPRMPTPLLAPKPRPSNRPRKGPLYNVDVFIDNFIGIGQGSRRCLRNLCRNILHAINEVLNQPLPTDKFHNEAASVKKLLQGDGSWATHKLILGWILDILLGTIELPPHRHKCLCRIFDDLWGKHRVSTKKWHKYLGELWFMSLGMPGSTGLFSALQLGLKELEPHRVHITCFIRESLDDFEHIAMDLATRPTRLAEIVPEEPTLIQAIDAAKAGMGGVIFTRNHPPILWHEPFPQWAQAQVVSWSNPTGKLTNSDLEQAAILAGADIACQEYDLQELTTATLTDNTPALSRITKGAVTAKSLGAYLYHLTSLHQQHYHYNDESSHIHGPSNCMADDTSRLQHLTDQQLLTHFNTTYPQERSWTLSRLTSKMNSAILSALSMNSDKVLSFLRDKLPV